MGVALENEGGDLSSKSQLSWGRELRKCQLLILAIKKKEEKRPVLAFFFGGGASESVECASSYNSRAIRELSEHVASQSARYNAIRL